MNRKTLWTMFLILVLIVSVLYLTGCPKTVIIEGGPGYPIYVPPSRIYCETRWRYSRWQGRMVPYQHCERY